MYTISSSEEVMTDARYTRSPYSPAEMFSFIHDQEYSEDAMHEFHLRQAKRLFDDMWHGFIPLRRPLTEQELQDYKSLFHHVLSTHQSVHKRRLKRQWQEREAKDV